MGLGYGQFINKNQDGRAMCCHLTAMIAGK